MYTKKGSHTSLLVCGLRLNEVVSLDILKIHVSEGYLIADGKGNKQRIVPIGLNARKSLLQYLSIRPDCGNQTALFVKDALIPITSSTVRQLFRRLKSQSGIVRLHPHLLRHTFATRYLENGGDIYSLQQILGHTSLEMVKNYVHLIHGKTVVSFPAFSPLDNILKTKKNG